MEWDSQNSYVSTHYFYSIGFIIDFLYWPLGIRISGCLHDWTKTIQSDIYKIKKYLGLLSEEEIEEERREQELNAVTLDNEPPAKFDKINEEIEQELEQNQRKNENESDERGGRVE